MTESIIATRKMLNLIPDSLFMFVSSLSIYTFAQQADVKVTVGPVSPSMPKSMLGKTAVHAGECTIICCDFFKFRKAQ